MSEREARRLVLAEDTCRAFRLAITTRVADPASVRRWDQALDYLNAWMKIAPKKYGLPTARIRRATPEPAPELQKEKR